MLSNPLLLAGDDNYQIQRSLRLRASASAYLSRTFGAGSQTTWTFSAWVKRGALGQQNIMQTGGVGGSLLYFGSGDNIRLSLSIGAAETFNTTAVYRDPSAWFHIQIAVDTTQATAADRAKLYINGTQVTAFSSTNYPALNATFAFNGAASHTFGQSTAQLSGFADLYVAEFNWVGGQALTPSSFGQTDPTTGVWTAKRYSGTYGTNGFYLPFTDTTSATTLCYDASGNSNHWTPTNIGGIGAGVTCDSMLDVPLAYGTTDRGNFATISPFQLAVSGPIFTLSSGNLNYSCGASAGSAGRMITRGTQALHSGKTYWEVKATNTNAGIGLIANGTMLDNGASGPKSPTLYNGSYSAGGSAASYAGTAWSFTTNDVIGLAFDGTAMTMACYKNGVLQGTVSGLEATEMWFPVFSINASASSTSMEANFGQRPFAYTPPTGFKALHTGNLPAPTILKPNKHFDVDTYTGTGATNTRSGFQFQPDLVWGKTRSVANSNMLTDSVRGATKELFSDLTNAEVTRADSLTSFNSNGYTLGVDTGSGYNTSGQTQVSWLWKAGGAAVTNNAGSISAQVSANAAAGFSIVTYTGTGANATVGHGLGVAPKMVITKVRGNAGYSWTVGHASSGWTNYLYLNTTAASAAAADRWQNTAPTSSVFSVGVDGAVNGSTQTLVAYCFAEIAGYSKFGSYTGNGSADGPFVFCGFRPRWVMVKRTDAANDWHILDTARDTYNPEQTQLAPNSSLAESSGWLTDFTSNGFKLRGATTDNTSGGTYIFMALAESPFQYSLAR